MNDSRRTFESKHPCERCGFTRRYVSTRACIECVRNAAYLSLCLPEGWQDKAKSIKDGAAALAASLGITEETIQFLLASFVVGCSGGRIKRFTGLSPKICGRLANNCRMTGLWSWAPTENGGTKPVLNYELIDGDDMEMAVALTLNCMVMEGSLIRNLDMTYSVK